MGRGVSSGGGQSSLGYLFGGGETPASNVQGGRAQNADVAPPVNGGRAQNAGVTNNQVEPVLGRRAQNAGVTNNQVEPVIGGHAQNAGAASPPIDKDIPAGVPGCLKNNYHRADGQNCGNFLTDRPSTKVHAAPGGGSSLGYLFGSPGGN